MRNCLSTRSKADLASTRQAAVQASADAAAGVTFHPIVDCSELDLCRSSWAWVSVHWYSQLPPSLRAKKKIEKFKKVKTWVVKNMYLINKLIGENQVITSAVTKVLL